MATFGELQTKVSKRLLDTNNVAVSLSDVADSINDAIRYYKKHIFWFNEINDSVNLTTGDNTIPVTGDFLVLSKDNDGLNIEYSQQRYPLKKISQNEFDRRFLDNGFGIPQVYAKIGQEYKCYPIPDRDYKLNRYYLKDYDPLEGASDTNDFTDNAERLIYLWACANLTAEFRQDDKMEAYYRNAATDEYNNLKSFTIRHNTSGQIQIDSTLL
jgi:hypothetical protein